MGFDSASALEALTTTKGNVEAACCVLLGEPITVERTLLAPASTSNNASNSSNGGNSSNSNSNNNSNNNGYGGGGGGEDSAAVYESSADSITAEYHRRIKTDHMKFMASFKTKRCNNASTSHDKRMCYFWHTRGDRRRSPFDVPYCSAECACFTTSQSENLVSCADGDACLRAHNMTERMFHPELFKITLCAHIGVCDRGLYCAFAHSADDHRTPVPISQLQGEAQHLRMAPREEDLNKPRIQQLLMSAGPNGLTSSEVKTKFFEAFGIKLVEDSASRLKVKEILMSLPGVTTTMIRGSQKYVYDVARATAYEQKKVWNAERAAAARTRPASTEAGFTAIQQNQQLQSGSVGGLGPGVSGTSGSGAGSSAVSSGGSGSSGNGSGSGASMWGVADAGMSFLSVDMENLNMNLLGGNVGGSLTGIGGMGAAENFHSLTSDVHCMETIGMAGLSGGSASIGGMGFSGYSGFDDAGSSAQSLYGGFDATHELGGLGDLGDMGDIIDLGQNITANLGFLGSLVGGGDGDGDDGEVEDIIQGGSGGGSSETLPSDATSTLDTFGSDYMSGFRASTPLQDSNIGSNSNSINIIPSNVIGGTNGHVLGPPPGHLAPPPMLPPPVTTSTRRRGPDSTLIASDPMMSATASPLVAFAPPNEAAPSVIIKTVSVVSHAHMEEIEAFKSENLLLKADLRDAKANLGESAASYGRTIATLTGKNEKLNAELQAAEAHKDKLSKQLKDKDAEIAALKDDNKKQSDEHHIENSRNEKDKSKLRAKIKELETDAALNSAANKTTESDLAASKNSVQMYTSQLTASKAELERYKTELVRVSGLLKRKTEDAEKREKEFRVDIADLRTTIDAKSLEFDQSAEILGKIIASSNIADSPEALQLIEYFQSQFGRGRAGAVNSKKELTDADKATAEAAVEPLKPRDAADVCAMPGCTLEGAFVCGRCSLTRYCGEAHQQACWKTHKAVCGVSK